MWVIKGVRDVQAPRMRHLGILPTAGLPNDLSFKHPCPLSILHIHTIVLEKDESQLKVYLPRVFPDRGWL